uniref:Uncharacterized protein n=1 Tax=Callorhinchus milii TaxID=7868 RepID=A0A4W3GZI0_CALMI
MSAGINVIKPGTIPVIKRRGPNWIDPPDDGFYMATEETRKIRKLLSPSEMRKSSRRPCTPVAVKHHPLSFTSSEQYRHPGTAGPIVIMD